MIVWPDPASLGQCHTLSAQYGAVLYDFTDLVFGNLAADAADREAVLARDFFITPANPPGVKLGPEQIAQARRAIRSGAWPENELLPREAVEHGYRVGWHLAQFDLGETIKVNRLYVFEFQGRDLQYLKFGYTNSLQARLHQHREPAFIHGFALLNGWASPGLKEAFALEQMILKCADRFPHFVRRGERFYGMKFETGRDIARWVCDKYE